MSKNELPLEELSIHDLYFGGGDSKTYEIPIYQRNYAWEKDEIVALVQDVWDAFLKSRAAEKDNKQKFYYIGTLVTFDKGDRVYEVIDGQQRLTTIRILLQAMQNEKDGRTEIKNKLTYRARKKSDETIRHMPDYRKVEEADKGIQNGYKYAAEALNSIDYSGTNERAFKEFFLHQVHIVHYHVPRDCDLNHYFEVMNSRGEQLEMHEILKANLMEKLQEERDHTLFNVIWNACSQMNTYIQVNLKKEEAEAAFGRTLEKYVCHDFDELRCEIAEKIKDEPSKQEFVSIADILKGGSDGTAGITDENAADRKDSFQPIIDFPNFLLIVLKLMRLQESSFKPSDFNLDDKELLNEFRKTSWDADRVKEFAFTLLKARFLLDNYMVHHTNEEDVYEKNPWKLQVWQAKDLKEGSDSKRAQLENLCEDADKQNRLVQLLSMFEVDFTARQRKNYLLYCLLHLMEDTDTDRYLTFAQQLADKFFYDVYMDPSKLNQRNVPGPGSFDDAVFESGKLTLQIKNAASPSAYRDRFNNLYGTVNEASNGMPLFIFNYLDYMLWDKYEKELRGQGADKESAERKHFFATLGCSDFNLEVFNYFYFSRTRRSLEHYYPQAMATGKDGSLTQTEINCFGNYAMIGSEANSSGSNWSPETKISHYLDDSRKISRISVSSLKFMIMMQACKDNEEKKWMRADIEKHQERMLDILFGKGETEKTTFGENYDMSEKKIDSKVYWNDKDAEKLFSECCPGFFELPNIRSMDDDEVYAELIWDLADYEDPKPPVEGDVKLELYHGDLEELRKAVAIVDEDWPAFFTEKSEIFVAWVEGKVASFCLLDQFGEHEFCGRKVKVGGPGCVGTLPEFRKRGIGARMVCAATQILKDRGYDISYIHYTGVEKWYMNMGFTMLVHWNKNGVIEG